MINCMGCHYKNSCEMDFMDNCDVYIPKIKYIKNAINYKHSYSFKCLKCRNRFNSENHKSFYCDECKKQKINKKLIGGMKIETRKRNN